MEAGMDVGIAVKLVHKCWPKKRISWIYRRRKCFSSATSLEGMIYIYGCLSHEDFFIKRVKQNKCLKSGNPKLMLVVILPPWSHNKNPRSNFRISDHKLQCHQWRQSCYHANLCALERWQGNWGANFISVKGFTKDSKFYICTSQCAGLSSAYISEKWST